MEWISVKDRMPEDGERVLLLQSDSLNSMEVGHKFIDHFYDSYDLKIEDITHWLPLPNPPKDSQERLLEEYDTKYIPLKD